MCRVENRGNITQPLAIPDRDINLTPALNLNLHERRLRSLWGTLAWCLLELANPTFPRIGSLLEVDASFQVAGRPLTQNMSNMRQLANIPTAIFPAENKTFATADEWYLELANMHLSQLVFQHNDLVSRKRLPEQIPGSRWLRALPPLLAAVIDWEFTYAAPVQFVLDPPWWLLFELPEMWEPSGVDGWSKAYEPQLKIWLAAMEDKEQEEEGARAAFLDGRPLSAHMRESWETGRFWLNYAAKKSWAFDATFLDERFFGPRDPEVADKDLWRTRLDLLGHGEQQAMEPLVKQKMDESREQHLS
ncbi:hypothetical protein GE09DRAFT_1065999 [Coniochaeta sp. 2T2.1]|nr:hypothetical protein GE09DRAFT_1065999 [Coniochaeta sp. 2T2.1]